MKIITELTPNPEMVAQMFVTMGSNEQAEVLSMIWDGMCREYEGAFKAEQQCAHIRDEIDPNAFDLIKALSEPEEEDTLDPTFRPCCGAMWEQDHKPTCKELVEVRECCDTRVDEHHEDDCVTLTGSRLIVSEEAAKKFTDSMKPVYIPNDTPLPPGVYRTPLKAGWEDKREKLVAMGHSMLEGWSEADLDKWLEDANTKPEVHQHVIKVKNTMLQKLYKCPTVGHMLRGEDGYWQGLLIRSHDDGTSTVCLGYPSGWGHQDPKQHPLYNHRVGDVGCPECGGSGLKGMFHTPCSRGCPMP